MSIVIYGLFFGIAKYPAGSTGLRSVFPLNSLTDRDRSAWPFNDQKGQTLHLLNQRPGFSLINLHPPDYKVIGYHWSQTSPRYIHKTGRLQSFTYENCLNRLPPPQKCHFGAFYCVENNFLEMVDDEIKGGAIGFMDFYKIL